MDNMKMDRDNELIFLLLLTYQYQVNIDPWLRTMYGPTDYQKSEWGISDIL